MASKVPLPAIRSVNTLMPGMQFRLVDAEGQILGRLAARLSMVLQGKDKPTYRPQVCMGDVVVVVNAEKIKLTGKKLDQMKYQWHTGWPGGFRERTVREQLEKKPEEVLKKAVSRMLPKNNLRPSRMRKLILNVGPDHSFPPEALKIWEMPFAPKSKDLKLDIPEGFTPLNPWAYPDFDVPKDMEYEGEYIAPEDAK